MSRRLSPWMAKADELLADGQWHDGLSWMRKVEREIGPGLAQRHTERVRSASARRRGSETAKERVRPLSLSAQIASGKRAMVTVHVLSRRRLGFIEVDPWPVPEGGWKTGGWKLRWIKPVRYSMEQLEDLYHIDAKRLRQLVLQEPPLKHDASGRALYLPHDELEALDRRVEAYRAKSHERRSAAVRRRYAEAKNAEPTHHAITVLAQHSDIGVSTARRVMAVNPDLGWVMRGRNTYLPVEQLPQWDRAVAEYMAGQDQRRIAINRRISASRRARGSASVDQFLRGDRW